MQRALLARTEHAGDAALLPDQLLEPVEAVTIAPIPVRSSRISVGPRIPGAKPSPAALAAGRSPSRTGALR